MAKSIESERHSRINRTEPADLRDVETWVFDLDNTLYPASIRLFDQIDRRMCQFVAEFLKIDAQEAYKIQKQYFREHGTTLAGMMNEHNMDPDHYLDYVHDIDFSVVPANKSLADSLSKLPGRKVVFTNAAGPYARRVLDRIEISDHFETIFDIVDADYIPKPDHKPYHQLISEFDFDPKGAVMVEDVARNLAPAAALGMTTVWITTDRPWAAADAETVNPDFVSDDLTKWLAEVVA
ncbi:MAG: pyrimidine 5'-nucleotidase [Proteobacteria bacterium]|nr:pyrimidine 5'-nucleotidase [Pseudomonadota bacterium]